MFDHSPSRRFFDLLHLSRTIWKEIKDAPEYVKAGMINRHQDKKDFLSCAGAGLLFTILPIVNDGLDNNLRSASHYAEIAAIMTVFYSVPLGYFYLIGRLSSDEGRNNGGNDVKPKSPSPLTPGGSKPDLEKLFRLDEVLSRSSPAKKRISELV